MLVLRCFPFEFHLIRELHQGILVPFSQLVEKLRWLGAVGACLGYIVAYPPAVLQNISWDSISCCWYQPMMYRCPVCPGEDDAVWRRL